MPLRCTEAEGGGRRHDRSRKCALPIVRGIKAPFEVEVGASQVDPDLLGYLLQGFQALRKEHHIRCKSYEEGVHTRGGA